MNEIEAEATVRYIDRFRAVTTILKKQHIFISKINLAQIHEILPYKKRDFSLKNRSYLVNSWS